MVWTAESWSTITRREQFSILAVAIVVSRRGADRVSLSRQSSLAGDVGKLDVAVIVERGDPAGRRLDVRSAACRPDVPCISQRGKGECAAAIADFK